MTHSIHTAALFSLLFTGLVAPATAATTACETDLVDDSPSPLSYQDRGDRCEGLYAQRVSSPSIEIRSFVESFEPFDPATDLALVVEWTPPANAGDRPLHLRALSLKPRTFYRMDAEVPASQGAYRWPTDVLDSLGLGRDDVGLVAWLPAGDAGGEVTYVPLRVAPGSGAAAAGEYQLAFVPSERLEWVRVALMKLGDDGTVTTVRPEQELDYGYYPSGRPTHLAVTGLAGTGRYRIRITVAGGGAGATEGGDSASADLVFFHLES